MNRNYKYISQVECVLFENMKCSPFLNRASSYIFVSFGMTKKSAHKFQEFVLLLYVKIKTVGLACLAFSLLNFSTLPDCLLKISGCNSEDADVCGAVYRSSRGVSVYVI